MTSGRLDAQLVFLVGINAAIVVAAMVIVGDRFMSLYNFQSMGTQVPELGLLAMGVMLAMVSGNGGIDGMAGPDARAAIGGSVSSSRRPRPTLARRCSSEARF